MYIEGEVWQKKKLTKNRVTLFQYSYITMKYDYSYINCDYKNLTTRKGGDQLGSFLPGDVVRA